MKSERLISASILPELLDYNPSTGKFAWRRRPLKFFESMAAPELRCRLWNGQFAGKPALYAEHNCGYHSGSIFNMQVLAHRVAWAITHGEWPSGEIDHVNGDRRDNRIENLRSVDRHGNMKNRKLQTINRSGANGVYWAAHAKKWRVEIRSELGREHCGYFDSFEDAKAARAEANERHGFHPNHGRSA